MAFDGAHFRAGTKIIVKLYFERLLKWDDYQIGFETPPLGENLFIASGITDTSIEDISLKAIPFSIMEISAVFLIAFVPALSLWLPKQLGY